MSGPRYALYALAEPGSALEAFGRTVLGYDNGTGEAVPHPADLQDLAEVTDGARIYGFHATLKAPMRLAPGVSEADLLAEAAGSPPITRPSLSARSPSRRSAGSSPSCPSPRRPPSACSRPNASRPSIPCGHRSTRPRSPSAAGAADPEGPGPPRPVGLPTRLRGIPLPHDPDRRLPDKAVEGWRARLAEAYARSGAGSLTIGSVAILRQDGGAPFRLVGTHPLRRSARLSACRQRHNNSSVFQVVQSISPAIVIQPSCKACLRRHSHSRNNDARHRELTRQYGTRRALDGVSLRIEPGSFVGVIGRSGRASRPCSAS